MSAVRTTSRTARAAVAAASAGPTLPAALPLTVLLDPVGCSPRGQATVLASLPASFRTIPVGAAPADVVVVDGDDDAWEGRVRSHLGATVRVVVLVGTAATTPARLRAVATTADATPTAVLSLRRWAADPAWLEALPDLVWTVVRADVVDCLAVVDPTRGALHGALVEQLALLERFRLADGLRSCAGGQGAYVVSGLVDGVAVTLAGAESAAGTARLELDVVGADTRWEVRSGLGGPAAPTTVTEHDVTGSRTRPLVHAGSHRESWSALAAVLAGGPTKPSDLPGLTGLRDLARLVERADALLGPVVAPDAVEVPARAVVSAERVEDRPQLGVRLGQLEARL